MSQFESAPRTTSPAAWLAGLIAGDFLVMFILIGWGRSTHALSATDLVGWLRTTAPFILAWFLVMPWVGLFRVEVSQNWQKLVPRLLLAWLLVGGPLGLVLRTLFLGRPLIGGIIPIFALVMLGTTTPAMLAWRLAYAWWARRRLSHPAVGGLEP